MEATQKGGVSENGKALVVKSPKNKGQRPFGGKDGFGKEDSYPSFPAEGR